MHKCTEKSQISIEDAVNLKLAVICVGQEVENMRGNGHRQAQKLACAFNFSFGEFRWSVLALSLCFSSADACIVCLTVLPAD